MTSNAAVAPVVRTSDEIYTAVRDAEGRPLLSGCYPDPTIERVGGDYYLATSTFEYFPGIPIFHSTDLVTWTQIGHALDSEGQLAMTHTRPSGGLFAPTLRHHDGQWYLICTVVQDEEPNGNFVMTADNPEGPWSDPIWFDDAPGIDPSLFFDEDGRAWYTGTKLIERDWPQQTVVWMREFDIAQRRLVGPVHELWSGAVTGAIWAEGPHIYRRGDWYYLLASEGGTSFFHALSVARSRSVTGPYEGFAGNPVFTHRTLGTGAPIQNVGHADLVAIDDERWAAVFLATRPVDGATVLGRETFIVDVEWQDDWPVFAPGRGRIDARPAGAEPASFPATAQWCQVRTDRHDFADIDEERREIRIRPLEGRPDEPTTPAFVGVRQRHHSFSLRGDIRVGGGIAARMSDNAFIWVERDETTVRVLGLDEPLTVDIDAAEIVSLALESDGADYVVRQRSADGDRVLASVAASHLSVERAGGFLGVWVGFLCHGEAETTISGVEYEGRGRVPVTE